MRYELNGLGEEWIWEADSQEDATNKYLKELGGYTLETYEEYCMTTGVDPELTWQEVK